MKKSIHEVAEYIAYQLGYPQEEILKLLEILEER